MNRCDFVHEEIYREIKNILLDLSKVEETGKWQLLDVGCWNGVKSVEYAKILNIKPENVWGIDINDDYIKEANKRIKAKKSDLEEDRLPFGDQSLDIIIFNQVAEHLKNIHWAFSELHRVLRPGGYLIVGVPNLASLHNRAFLLTGKQPSSIRVFGPHVRGFTSQEMKDLLTYHSLFRVTQIHGVGFYPFTNFVGWVLGKKLSSLAHTLIFVANKNVGLADWHKDPRVSTAQTDFHGAGE